jgi:hypothetical protein
MGMAVFFMARLWFRRRRLATPDAAETIIFP